MTVSRKLRNSFKVSFAASATIGLAAKIVGFLTSAAMAFYYGTNSATDLYFYALSLISFFNMFMTNPDAIGIIPESMRLRERNGHDASWGFLNTWALLFFLTTTLFALLFFLFNPVRVLLWFSQFQPSVAESNALTLRLCTPLVVLTVLNTFLSDILCSYRYFAVSGALSLLGNVVLLGAIVLLHDHLHVAGAMVGSLLANMFQLAILLVLVVLKGKWRPVVSVKAVDRNFIFRILYAQLGYLVATVAGFVPLSLISGFGPGAVSTMNYGMRVADMVTALVTVQFSNIIGVKFNELFAKNELSKIDSAFRSGAHLIAFILLPISFLLYIFSHEIISVLFMRGAFNAASVRASANFLSAIAFILPLLAYNTMVARLFMAAGKTNSSVPFQIATSAFTILLSYVMIKWFGPVGYPVALVVSYVVNILSVNLLIRRHFSSVHYWSVIVSLAKLVTVNLAVALPIYFISSALKMVPGIPKIAIGTAAYTLCLLLINHILRISPVMEGLISSTVGKIGNGIRGWGGFHERGNRGA